MSNIILKYCVGDSVTVNELKFVMGRIITIQISKAGTEYQVRYFDGCEAKFAWFYEDELEN